MQLPAAARPTPLTTAPPRRMEEAFLEAVQRLGGAVAATPSPLMDELAAEFPFLTYRVRAAFGARVKHGSAACAGASSPRQVRTRPHPLLDLPLQDVRYHLLSHRKRLQRRQNSSSGDSESGAPPPLKWMWRLGAAFEAAVESLGGLLVARPRAIAGLLVAEFPEVSVQVGVVPRKSPQHHTLRCL